MLLLRIAYVGGPVIVPNVPRSNEEGCPTDADVAIPKLTELTMRPPELTQINRIASALIVRRAKNKDG